jgi:hypothetical protein
MAFIEISSSYNIFTNTDTTSYDLKNANSNILLTSVLAGKGALISEIINIDVASTQSTTTTFDSNVIINVNKSDLSESSNQTLFKFKTTVSNSSTSSNEVLSITKVSLTDDSTSSDQITFKQSIQAENFSQSAQTVSTKQSILIDNGSTSSNEVLVNQKLIVNDESLSLNDVNGAFITNLAFTNASNSEEQIETLVITFAEAIDGSSTSDAVAFEVVESVNGIVVDPIEIDVFVNDLEPGIDVDGLVVRQQETDLVLGDPAPIRNLMASLEPAVDQPGFGTQFMLLNQYETPLQGTVSNSPTVIFDTLQVDADNKPKYDIKDDREVKAKWDLTRSKDIVWYGRLGSYANAIDSPLKTTYASRVFETLEEFFDSKFADAYDAVYPVTLNPTGAIDPDEDAFYAGPMRLATPVKAVSITKNSVALPLTKVRNLPPDPSDEAFLFDEGLFDVQGLSSLYTEEVREFVFTIGTSYMFGESTGGRNLFDVTNGRSYVGSTAGGAKQETFTYKGLPFDGYDVPDKISPYVLMPDDELAVACVVQPAPFDPSEYLDIDRESEEYLKQPSIEPNIPKFKTRISGPGRIVLYGTYLRDGEPISPESSQPLTSLSIHEDVRGDVSPYGGSYCMDQFTLEPRTSLRNGYLDRIVVGNVTGSLPLPFANVDEVDEVDARYASGSVVDGTSKFKKGLQRFVRLVNDRETYYDSHVPQLQAILNAFGVVEGNVNIQLDPEVEPLPLQNPIGLLFFSPFDPSLSTDQRSDNVRDAVKGSTATEFALKSFQVTSGSTEIFDLVAADFDPIFPSSLTPKQIVSLIYGALDYNYDGSSSEIDEGQRVLDILRGYRYGLMSAFPLGRSACFRHDRYGQFRDMFETSPDSILYEEVELVGGSIQRGLGKPPVRVRFVKRGSQELVLDPEQTNSQNLSAFATSSLPYFDGASMDRLTPQPDTVIDTLAI